MEVNHVYHFVMELTMLYSQLENVNLVVLPPSINKTQLKSVFQIVQSTL